jgi:hypothetical protein
VEEPHQRALLVRDHGLHGTDLGEQRVGVVEGAARAIDRRIDVRDQLATAQAVKTRTECERARVELLMRAMILLALVTGCLENEPGASFEARLTYDGVRNSATITFPPYSHGDTPVMVIGTVRGDAPITYARLDHGKDRTYMLSIDRKPDDTTYTGPVQCVLTDDDIGHATACSNTGKSCSVVMEVLP